MNFCKLLNGSVGDIVQYAAVKFPIWFYCKLCTCLLNSIL